MPCKLILERKKLQSLSIKEKRKKMEKGKRKKGTCKEKSPHAVKFVRRGSQFEVIIAQQRLEERKKSQSFLINYSCIV